MSALICKKQDVETMNYTKNVLMKGLILFTLIYKMYAVLNLLTIHEKDNIDNIIFLLAKQNPLIYCQCQRELPPHLDCLPKLIS